MTRCGILSTTRLAKPWGRCNLPAVFADPGNEPVGEIWFESPPPLATILAKYLFTEERLSVQVHPIAANSQTGSGKDECWLVTDARPGARLAVGFRETADADAVRDGAIDGSILSMLNWIDVKKNDFIYVPAGTVHSMGGGAHADRSPAEHRHYIPAVRLRARSYFASRPSHGLDLP